MPDIVGIFDFHLASGARSVVRADDLGNIWEDYESTIKTGWTENQKIHISQISDEIIFCNGADKPTVWDGSAGSTTDLANVPTDWTGTNYPKQMVQHGRGNSLRNWALGCPDNPKTIYVTPDGTPKDFTQGTILTFHIETGDGSGVVGGIEFGDRLILLSKNRSFIIDDSDTDTDSWGYSEAQWVGGVAHHRLIVRTPNDIVCMMEDGEIYSVAAAESYGDYRAASLTRPSYMHEWIKTYIDLSKIGEFHALYDPTLRAVKFFMVRAGDSKCSVVLAYFIDKPPEKAWVILDNQDFESGYSAASSCIIRVSTGLWKVVTGSYAGRLWYLGQAVQSDNSEAYVASMKTPLLLIDNARESKRFDKIRIISASEGTNDGTVRWWIDGGALNSENIVFATEGTLLGVFVLDTDVLGGVGVLENVVSVGQIGKRIQVEVLNNTEAQDFFLSQLLIDFLPLGPQP